MSVFPPTSKHLCSWAGLRCRTMRVPGRRKTLESAEHEPTSNHYLFNAPSMLSGPSNTRKSEIATSLSRSVVDTRKPSSPLPKYFYQLSTICSREMSQTILNFIARVTGLPPTECFLRTKPSLSSCGKAIW